MKNVKDRGVNGKVIVCMCADIAYWEAVLVP